MAAKKAPAKKAPAKKAPAKKPSASKPRDLLGTELGTGAGSKRIADEARTAQGKATRAARASRATKGLGELYAGVNAYNLYKKRAFGYKPNETDEQYKARMKKKKK